MVSRDGHEFAALVAKRDIYDGDEILLKFAKSADGHPYKIDQSDEGMSYETKQLRFKVQGLWQQHRDKDHPKMPVIREGIHMGQKYDKRYIPDIPH